MHLALPRKTSSPPPYAPRSASRPRLLQRLKAQNPRFLALVVLGVISLFYTVRWLFSGAALERIPSGTPPVVMVTVFDDKHMDEGLVEAIKLNRIQYAERHGYATFFPNSTTYPLNSDPPSWTKVPAVRHALTKFPHSPYYFYLSPHALIANPSLTIESHIMDAKRLESVLIADTPVVPPDSVIKTFHLKAEHIDVVLTQDKDGLSPHSFVLRGGEWAKFFLDIWFDPIYRSYNFQKAEGHALEHIVQWHGTILTHLALVPQRLLNAYSKEARDLANKSGAYERDDFVIHFHGCDKQKRSCAEEMKPYLTTRKTEQDED